MNNLLNIPAEDREKALTLGALLDAKSGQLFVPVGMELTQFNAWLPQPNQPGTIALVPQHGISLTELLARAKSAIGSAFPRPEWVRIEISDLKERANGHRYLEAIERDTEGKELSKSRAIIWNTVASKLGAKFHQATGAILADGMKVLVLVQPKFDGRFGLSLEITDIDPNFTLGDMQALLRSIREELQKKGDANLNRDLPAPVDFTHIGVIAPENAAGLEDFQAGATLLERAGLCSFHYFHATFEGENARETLKQAFYAAHYAHEEQAFDALVVIRGGGANAGLAWLNEYVLARIVCRFRCPVFTGIGHEKDSTILDEFSHSKFGTPSKVIGHIREVIAARANKALEDWTAIVESVSRRLSTANGYTDQRRLAISTCAARKIDQFSFSAETNYQEIRSNAVTALEIVSGKVEALDAGIKSGAIAKLGLAHAAITHAHDNVRDRALTALEHVDVRARNNFDSVTLAAKRSIDGVEEHIEAHLQGILGGTASVMKNLEDHTDRSFDDVRFFAKKMLGQAEDITRELIGGIISHGVDPTMRRGFAVVKSEGKPISSKAAAENAPGELELVFRDGTLRVKKEENSHG